MSRPFTIIGAPTSAGAYAPGQEKAPRALRDAGLHGALRRCGVAFEDAGDVEGFRWRADKQRPRAMNADAAASVAGSVAELVSDALSRKFRVLVLGGDCSVELGTVAGALMQSDKLGLIYVDLDVDLNTPDSTTDGALDWMGVAHLLGIQGSVPALAGLGPRMPMLRPDEIILFAHDNVTDPERKIINTYSIAECPVSQVTRNPARAAQSVLQTWAHKFELLLIHLDVDVLDYLDMPLAENVRRNVGLQFSQLVEAMDVLLTAPNFAALTVCELNPDHGAADLSTLATFNDALGRWLAKSV